MGADQQARAIEAIAREMGITPAEVSARESFFEFTSADTFVLEEVHEALKVHRERLAAALYDHIGSFDPPRNLLGDEQNIARLKLRQQGYFGSLTLRRGGWDDVLQQLTIGAAHQRIGVEPKWYIGAYRKYLSEFLRVLWRLTGAQPARFLNTFDALLKRVMLDMSLALETYFHADRRRIAEKDRFARAVLDRMPAGVAMADAGLKVRYANAVLARMFGLENASAAWGMDLGALLPLAGIADAAIRAIETGEEQRGVASEVRIAGRRHSFEFAATGTRLDGQPMVLVTVQDVTQAADDQRALRRFRAALDVAGDAILIIDRSRRAIVDVNETASRLTGRDRGELLSMRADALIAHPGTEEDSRTFEELMDEAAEGDPAVEAEVRRKDGSSFPAEIHFRALAADGEDLVVVTLRNITERRLATARLNTSEAIHRSTFELAAVGIAHSAIDARIIRANRAMHAHLGLEEPALVGRTFAEFTPPDDNARMLRLRDELLQGLRESYGAEVRHLRGDGTIGWVEVTGSLMRDERGAPRFFISVVKDVTQRRLAENALRESEQRLRTITDNVPAMIGYVDADQRYRFVNREYCKWIGLTAAELMGRTVREAIGEERYAQVRRQIEATLSGGESVTYERTWQGAGDPRHFRITRVPDAGPDSAVRGYYSIAFDVTDYRRSQERLEELAGTLEQRVAERTAELLAANQELESFSYSVSHDLRAPVRAILGFSEILLDDGDEPPAPRRRDLLERIRANCDRMNRMINSLLDLSRLARQKIEPVPVDLSAMAEEVLAALRAEQPGRQVESRVSPGVVAQGDEELLRVLMQNLLSNAWKYTAKREPARIEFGWTTGGEDQPPEYFVRDNGAGFDMSFADRLFGAFQRLHRAGEFPGEGVGLATARRVVLRHGGRIRAESAVDAGATFRFTLWEP